MSLSEPAEFRSATSMHSYQNLQCSVTPSWCEASKTSNPENQTHFCKCKPTVYTYNIHSHHIKNTHKHSFNTWKMQEKTAICIKYGKHLYFTRCFRARPVTRSRLLSFTVSRRLSSILASSLLQNEILNPFLPKGLSENFPLIYLPYSITLNGLSSPQMGSRSQPYKHLRLTYSNACTKAWLYGSTS